MKKLKVVSVVLVCLVALTLMSCEDNINAEGGGTGSDINPFANTSWRGVDPRFDTAVVVSMVFTGSTFHFSWPHNPEAGCHGSFTHSVNTATLFCSGSGGTATISGNNLTVVKRFAGTGPETFIFSRTN